LRKGEAAGHPGRLGETRAFRDRERADAGVARKSQSSRDYARGDNGPIGCRPRVDGLCTFDSSGHSETIPLSLAARSLSSLALVTFPIFKM